MKHTWSFRGKGSCFSKCFSLHDSSSHLTNRFEPCLEAQNKIIGSCNWLIFVLQWSFSHFSAFKCLFRWPLQGYMTLIRKCNAIDREKWMVGSTQISKLYYKCHYFNIGFNVFLTWWTRGAVCLVFWVGFTVFVFTDHFSVKYFSVFIQKPFFLHIKYARLWYSAPKPTHKCSLQFKTAYNFVLFCLQL